MALLKITLANGDASTHKITPAIEYAFEQHAGKGFYKAIVDDQRQSDIYWIAWRCLFSAGVEIKPFGEKFLETLEKVEVVDENPKD
jgi:hypothetical protein